MAPWSGLYIGVFVRRHVPRWLSRRDMRRERRDEDGRRQERSRREDKGAGTNGAALLTR